MAHSLRCHSDMDIPIPKTLVLWVSPSHFTLAIRVRVSGDANITRVLGMGMPISQLHCHLRNEEGNWDELTFAKTTGTVTRDRGKKLANS